MSILEDYYSTAEAYSEGTQKLFAPSSGSAFTVRGGQGPKSYGELAEEAEKLVPVSEALTAKTEQLFNAPDPSVRIAATEKLLAKASVDFEICEYLLQNAKDQERDLNWVDGAGAERSGASGFGLANYLDILLQKDESERTVSERTSQAGDIQSAKSELSDAVEDTLFLIRKRAGKAGQSAAAGVLGLGLAELGKATGEVIANLADMLGQSEKVSRLYELFRSFFAKAWESVKALVGEGAARQASEKFLKWIDDLNSEENSSKCIERYYRTESTRQQLLEIIIGSNADPAAYDDLQRKVVALDHHFQKQVKLAEKLLERMSWAGTVSAAILPQGKLIAGALYVLLGADIILVGGDYVDASDWSLLDRVPGVRRVVEEVLMPSR